MTDTAYGGLIIFIIGVFLIIYMIIKAVVNKLIMWFVYKKSDNKLKKHLSVRDFYFYSKSK